MDYNSRNYLKFKIQFVLMFAPVFHTMITDAQMHIIKTHTDTHTHTTRRDMEKIQKNMFLTLIELMLLRPGGMSFDF